MEIPPEVLQNIIDLLSIDGLKAIRSGKNSNPILASMVLKRLTCIAEHLDKQIAEKKEEWKRMAQRVFERYLANHPELDANSTGFMPTIWRANILQALQSSLDGFSTSQLEAIASIKRQVAAGNPIGAFVEAPPNSSWFWARCNWPEYPDCSEEPVYTMTMNNDKGLVGGQLLETEAQWKLVERIRELQAKRDALGLEKAGALSKNQKKKEDKKKK